MGEGGIVEWEAGRLLYGALEEELLIGSSRKADGAAKAVVGPFLEVGFDVESDGKVFQGNE